MLYDGDCIIRRDGDGLYVVAADQRIRFAPELIDEIRVGQHHPAVSILGDVITIKATNRTIIYRLTGQQPDGLNYWYTAELQ